MKPGPAMSKARRLGLETHRTVWIRKDVMAAIEIFQDEYKKKYGKRITFKDLFNEALFDLVMRKKMELKHGEPITIKDTYVDPDTNETKRNPL